MTILEQLSSGTMYLICGVIVAFVAVVCVVFMVRAWRAGKAIGMDTARMKRTITASATFSVLPSVGILLGVIALSGSLGIPWPWLRLSVIGALHYETQVASAAAEQLGLTLSGETMTAQAFSTIALLMSVCIMWGMILATLFGKRYLKKLGGGQEVYYKKQIGDILAKFSQDYPARLNLYDQGIFQLGYYHQTQARYTKKEDKENE